MSEMLCGYGYYNITNRAFSLSTQANRFCCQTCTLPHKGDIGPQSVACLGGKSPETNP